jgi:hypothetical protein
MWHSRDSIDPPRAFDPRARRGHELRTVRFGARALPTQRLERQMKYLFNLHQFMYAVRPELRTLRGKQGNRIYLADDDVFISVSALFHRRTREVVGVTFVPTTEARFTDGVKKQFGEVPYVLARNGTHDVLFGEARKFVWDCSAQRDDPKGERPFFAVGGGIKTKFDGLFEPSFLSRCLNAPLEEGNYDSCLVEPSLRVPFCQSLVDISGMMTWSGGKSGNGQPLLPRGSNKFVLIPPVWTGTKYSVIGMAVRKDWYSRFTWMPVPDPEEEIPVFPPVIELESEEQKS